MAKNSLAKSEVEGKALAGRQPSALQSSFDVGDSSGGGLSMLGRLTVWNGSPKQKAEYGGAGKSFNDGDLVDMLEKRKAATNQIVPVYGFTIFQRWDKDAKAPTYTYGRGERHRVPPEDFERGADGSSPACYEALCLVCLVVGEMVPYQFVFKRTSRRAGDDIMRHEARRKATGLSPGVYKIGVKADKNPAGQDYLRVILDGVPTNMDQQTEALFAMVAGQLELVKASAIEAAKSGDGDMPGADDEIPI